MKKLRVIALMVITLSGCGGGGGSAPSSPPGTSTQQSSSTPQGTTTKRVSPPRGGAAKAAKAAEVLGGPYKCVRMSGPHVAGGVTGWLYVCHDRKRHEVDVILGSDGSALNVHNVPD